MGRTGRRPGTARNCLFLTTTHEALLIAAGLARLWQEGFVENIVPPRRPLHILAQQIIALILQQNGLPENSFRNWVGKTFRSVETSDATALLSHMKLTGVLAEDQGILGISPAGEEILGRRNFIELMSTFTTPLLISVRCGNTELGVWHRQLLLHRRESQRPYSWEEKVPGRGTGGGSVRHTAVRTYPLAS